jgi:hypothetical protein
MVVTCLGDMEKKGESRSTDSNGNNGEMNNRSTNGSPGTPARPKTPTGADNGKQADKTKMDVETTMTPTMLARANKILDQDDTPAKEANKSPFTRHASVGITALTNKLENLAKNTGIPEDDDVFGKTNQIVTGPGVPDQAKDNNKVRNHSGLATVGSPKVITGIGTGDGTRAGISPTEAGGAGSVEKTREKNFPPAYYNVRKLRANSQPTTELHSITGDRRGKVVKNHNKLTPSFELKDDERQHTVKNFHIPSLKRNVSSNIVREGNELKCVTCKNTHSFTGTDPVCLILTDQNFPPALPSENTDLCCVIIRLKDCFLSELPGILKEYFGNRSGYLPEGSLLMFGSLSHLGKRGLENYAEECVKMNKVFGNMLPKTCSVTHLLAVPLGGIESEGLIRDLYDLDCWLRISTGTNIPSLPAARTKLWEILSASNTPAGPQTDRTLFLPESLSSSTKVRTISEKPESVPAKIGPMNDKDEKVVIETLCREINENYVLNIEENPMLTRCSETTKVPVPETAEYLQLAAVILRDWWAALRAMTMKSLI